MRKLVSRLASVPFVQKALEENADLSAFKGRPSLRAVLGVSAILLSYVICWPVIALLSAVAATSGQTAIILIGGPLDYALSHLLFLLGIYLAGARYSYIFLRWLTRAAMLKLIRRYPGTAPPVPSSLPSGDQLLPLNTPLR